MNELYGRTRFPRRTGLHIDSGLRISWWRNSSSRNASLPLVSAALVRAPRARSGYLAFQQRGMGDVQRAYLSSAPEASTGFGAAIPTANSAKKRINQRNWLPGELHDREDFIPGEDNLSYTHAKFSR